MSTANGPATVGFAGLGAMGLPMAVNLARAGIDTVAWNRSAAAGVRAAAAGVRVVARPADVSATASTVITMLPDLPQVRQLLEAPDGLLGAGTRLDTLVVMGTVSPVGVRELAGELRPRGVAVIDAPVSGGRRGATDATLSIMVGSDERDFGRLRPYLDAMGRTVRHMGPVGTGSLTKACNQLVVAGTLAALAEAVVLGERGGLAPEALLDVLGGGLAASEVLIQKRDHLVGGDFHGSGPADYLVKDLGFGLASAADSGADLPVTTAVAALYRSAVADGLGHLDNSVILDVLRRRAR
ncbi:NAD(P)-dependent oxidoreductase [Actinoplanes sp. ATCC 53533]|uniref:NAD(P)-dependent oxidoreductase n=1 Tax=Actinoplanes sp. ATCC 53533 TaxID=1288362 RepID=UPI000F799569|nr:NAD(P)-dependent oxidoreductase [Actinoplanes sp. ATCC 53533]RSM54906.1 NAD(P)-dependent oxidoreductase [Actinoplanes sp. ATCC 53533]